MDIESLQELIEQRIDLLEKHMNEKFKWQEESLKLASDILDKKLVEMNEFRKEERERNQDYVRIDVWNKQYDILMTKINIMEKNQDKLFLYMSMAGFVGGGIGSVIVALILDIWGKHNVVLVCIIYVYTKTQLS